MTECYFSQPEDVVGRKQLKELKFYDVFPQQNPYYNECDDYFPEHVTKFVHQLRSQEHLRKTAQIVNKHLEEINLKSDGTLPYMTDDQKRVQKIKDRLMKRKQQQQQEQK
jgi:hypothetical protein